MKGTPIKDIINNLLNQKKENNDDMMKYKPVDDIMIKKADINGYDFPMIQRYEFPVFSKEETNNK